MWGENFKQKERETDIKRVQNAIDLNKLGNKQEVKEWIENPNNPIHNEINRFNRVLDDETIELNFNHE